MTNRQICYICKSDYDPSSEDYNADLKEITLGKATYSICPRCSNMLVVAKYMFDDNIGTVRQILKCHQEVIQGNNSAIQRIIEFLNR